MELFKLFGTIAIKNSDANKAIDETDKKAKTASSGVKSSFGKMKDAGTDTGKSLKQIAEEQGKSINELRSDVAKAAAEYKKSGMTASEAMKKAYSDIGYSARENQKKTDLFKKGIGDTADESEKAESKISSALKKIGTAVAAAFAIDKIKSFGQAIVNTTASFEDSMLKVQSLSGATGAEYDKLTEAALEYGSTTAWTAKDVGDAMGYMALAGFNTNDILESTSGMLSLASASGEDLATVTDILTDSMTGFGDSAEDATRYADVLSTVQAKSNTTVGLLGEAFKYVSPLAGSYKYKLEDVSTALGMMANAGVKGSMAGTSLSSIITRLGTNTDGITDKLKEMGVQFYNNDGTARDLSSVLMDLCDVTKDMDTAEKASLASKIAGQEAQKGLLAILNQGSGEYEKLQKQLNNCSGTASDMAQNMESGLGGSIRSVQSAVEGMEISLGQKVSPGLGKVIHGIAGFITEKLTPALEKGIDKFGELKDFVVDKFSPVIDSAKELIGKIVDKLISLKDSLTGGKSGSDILKNGLENLATALKTAIDKTSSLIDWMSKHKGVMIALATVYGIVKIAIAAYNIVQGIKAAMNAAEATSLGALIAMKLADAAATMAAIAPYILIVAAIAAVIAIVVVLIKHWDKVKEVAKKVWDKITGFVSNAWQKIKDVFGGIGDWFSEKFHAAWEGIKNAFSSVGEFFGGIWDTIKSKFTSIGTKIGDAVGGAFKSVINGILTFIEDKINGFFGFINGALDLINKIPGVNIPHIPDIDLPELEEGGILPKGKTGLLEGNGAEAVIPLDQNRAWTTQVAKQLAEMLPERKSTALENYSISNSSIKAEEQQKVVISKLDKIISLISVFFPQLLEALDMQIIMDGDKLAIKLVPKINKKLGETVTLSERGLA